MGNFCSMGFTLRQLLTVVCTILLSTRGAGLPLLPDIAKAGSLELMVSGINEHLMNVESDARVSRVFYMRNITMDREPENLQKKVFAQLLLSSGYESMEGKVSMTWNKIISTAGPFDEENYSLCRTVFTPDHLLSKVILENLISSNDPAMEQKVMGELTRLFCNHSVNRITMYYMQTDDVISGLIIVSVMNNRSLLALANVGF